MSNEQRPNGAGTADRWAHRIAQDTARLRGSTEPEICRIRDLLRDSGVDIGSSLVANLMPEDTDLLSGFVVTGEKRVYEFEYDWRRATSDQGRLAVWRDITGTYKSRAFREAIAAALHMISRQQAPATLGLSH